MNTTALDDTGELRAACTAAQLQAERHFGAAPPPLWEPGAGSATPDAALVRRWWWPWRWAGLGALAVAVALGAWVAVGRTAEAAAVPTPAPAAGLAADDDVADVDASEAPAATSVAHAAPPVALAVRRSGPLWHVDAQQASRLDAARQLAELSGSALHGSLELLAQARPLDLHWQGRILAQAWERVLGPDLNYALQCRRDRCEAWIVAAALPGSAVDRPAAVIESAAVADVDDARDSRDSRDKSDNIDRRDIGDAGASFH